VTARTFSTLGFKTSYSCETDPEFPAAGDWGCPSHGFARDGQATDPFRSRWGAPLIARFHLADGAEWVGLFEAGGMSGIDGVFACPAPGSALVVCDGQAYLVDVTIPGHAAAISLSPITQVQKAGGDLLALASFSGLTAIGPQGQAWTSERLCLDDLRILDADEHTISCCGSFLEGSEGFAVGTHTGQHQAGRRFLDSWPAI
jgi:hypothetical protein